MTLIWGIKTFLYHKHNKPVAPDMIYTWSTTGMLIYSVSEKKKITLWKKNVFVHFWFWGVYSILFQKANRKRTKMVSFLPPQSQLPSLIKSELVLVQSAVFNSQKKRSRGSLQWGKAKLVFSFCRWRKLEFSCSCSAFFKIVAMSITSQRSRVTLPVRGRPRPRPVWTEWDCHSEQPSSNIQHYSTPTLIQNTWAGPVPVYSSVLPLTVYKNINSVQTSPQRIDFILSHWFYFSSNKAATQCMSLVSGAQIKLTAQGVN